MPGVLPVLNRKAVEYATRMALAIHAQINQRSQFARKNYFYPDMPKDYQISQFELPLCEHGWLDITVDGQKRRIGITRIHMEDDAGKNIHPQGENFSYVDLNRAGTPLIEIVSEPDLRSAEEAVAYLKKLHAMVVSLGISNGNMEEGCFRCDANVSIRPRGETKLGTRTELKNLNSFRNVQRAIEFEIARQSDLLDDGEKVIQETRLYDANRNLTAPMRSKEDAQDYRYFPDPDLLPVVITDEELAEWAATQPELPEARMARYMGELQLPEQDAEQLCSDPHLAELFEKTCALGAQPKKAANIMLGMLLREINQTGVSSADIKITPEAIAELVAIIGNGTISAKIAADIFPETHEGRRHARGARQGTRPRSGFGHRRHRRRRAEGDRRPSRRSGSLQGRQDQARQLLRRPGHARNARQGESRHGQRSSGPSARPELARSHGVPPPPPGGTLSPDTSLSLLP